MSGYHRPSVGATVEEVEVNYESLFTTNNLDANARQVKGARSDGLSALYVGTSIVEVKPASDGVAVFNVKQADGTSVLAVDTSTPKVIIASNLEFTGAQTITTSTGQLDIQTGAGNGDIVLTPHGSGDIILDGHWNFNANALTSLTDNNTTITAYAGKNITIESVTFDGGAVAAITTLDMTGDLTIGSTTRITLGGGANDDGIVFASLGTATKAIDFSSDGLAGATDYHIYIGAADYWAADGSFSATVIAIGGVTITGDITTTATAIDWDLIDNNASALSFDAAGKAGILEIVTTNAGEGVNMSGFLTVTGTVTGGTLTDGTASITGGAITGVGTLTATGNLDIGAHDFRALSFTSDVAIGTAPLVVTSTTVVANLNVDQVDGYDLDQDVTTSGTPTFAALTVSGLTTLSGGLITKRTASATDYTALATDQIIAITDTTVARAITLNTALLTAGRTYIIVDESGAAGTNNITIQTQGAETINGAATLVISVNYGAIFIYTDGSNWFAIYEGIA